MKNPTLYSILFDISLNIYIFLLYVYLQLTLSFIFSFIPFHFISLFSPSFNRPTLYSISTLTYIYFCSLYFRLLNSPCGSSFCHLAHLSKLFFIIFKINTQLEIHSSQHTFHIYTQVCTYILLQAI